MAAIFPRFSSKKPIVAEHFPTPAQCFIYRNWEMLSPSRIALVLDSDETTVCRMAADMGLAENNAPEALWLQKGYITLIRANWHLLTYEQLCLLLGWSDEYLAFILREDDFLDIKLGLIKPNVPPLRITPLDEAGRARTAEIAAITRETLAAVGERTVPPFAFREVYPEKDAIPAIAGKSRFAGSFCYSYCALYGDTFADERLIDESFPEELLASYAAMGIGGIWTQAVLYALIPCPYAPELSDGWEKRIAGLNKVIARLKKYGLKLYLYLNEPRDLPEAFFESRPDLRGDVYREGRASLCLSVPEAQDFLRDSIARLTALAPGLGGYVTIVASENHTNCYSHKMSGETTCPRCKGIRRSDMYALINRLILEGARSVDPDITVSAFNWSWDAEEGCLEETIKKMPPEIPIIAVSEHSKKRKFEDTEVAVRDYSISITGPSEHSLNTFRVTRENGKRIGAKLQLNCSWELSPLPYIPAFGHFYRSIRDLCEKADPDLVMMTWTLGGFPSPVLRMFSEMTQKDAPMPSEAELRRRLFPDADDALLERAFAKLDEALDEYPFSIRVMYSGPQHMGPALPLYDKPTGWNACMVGPVYDDLEYWRTPFPRDLFYRQWDKLSSGWAEGLALLREAFANTPDSRVKQVLLDSAEACYLHFRSSRNHVAYVMRRDAEADTAPEAEKSTPVVNPAGYDAMVAEVPDTEADLSTLPTVEEILAEEEALALAEARLMGHDPAIGYESSNHYFFTRSDLLEKVLNCRYLAEKL